MMITRAASPMMVTGPSLTASPATGAIGATGAAQGKQQGTSGGGSVLQKAYEVYISDRGKELNEKTRRERDLDDLTPTEHIIRAMEIDRNEKQEKKSLAAQIEERIENDATLSDEDKVTLGEQAEQLRKEGMTDQDKLNDLNARKYGLLGQIGQGHLTPMDEESAMQIVADYDNQIAETTNTILKQGRRLTDLIAQANQERSNQLASTMRERQNALDERNAASGRADGVAGVLAYAATQKDASWLFPPTEANGQGNNANATRANSIQRSARSNTVTAFSRLNELAATAPKPAPTEPVAAAAE